MCTALDGARGPLQAELFIFSAGVWPGMFPHARDHLTFFRNGKVCGLLRCVFGQDPRDLRLWAYRECHWMSLRAIFGRAARLMKSPLEVASRRGSPRAQEKVSPARRELITRSRAQHKALCDLVLFSLFFVEDLHLNVFGDGLLAEEFHRKRSRAKVRNTVVDDHFTGPQKVSVFFACSRCFADLRLINVRRTAHPRPITLCTLIRNRLFT